MAAGNHRSAAAGHTEAHLDRSLPGLKMDTRSHSMAVLDREPDIRGRAVAAGHKPGMMVVYIPVLPGWCLSLGNSFVGLALVDEGGVVDDDMEGLEGLEEVGWALGKAPGKPDIGPAVGNNDTGYHLGIHTGSDCCYPFLGQGRFNDDKVQVAKWKLRSGGDIRKQKPHRQAKVSWEREVEL